MEMSDNVDRERQCKGISVDKEKPKSLRNFLIEKVQRETPCQEQEEVPVESILIVEDNADNAEVMQAILQSQNIQGDVVTNANDALAYCEKNTPQMVLMDIGLPGMNGLDLTKKMREMAHYREIPILAVSAHGSPKMKARALASGCNDFIAKPYLPKDIVHTVKNYMGN